VVGERHPAYLGVYEGAMGPELARERVEDADLLLILGAIANDVDTGICTARLDPQRIIHASHDRVSIRHHRYQQVYLGDYLDALRDAVEPHTCDWPALPALASLPPARPGKPISVARLIASLNAMLGADMSVVCDVGDCLFAALDLRVHERTRFLASAFYTSMGFAVPAALGAQIAHPDYRPLILVGDGAFQMTGTELSTIAPATRSGGHRVQQPRLQHRALHSRRTIQRHRGLELRAYRRTDWTGARLRRRLRR
jgi:TPP-dependent 2-oxoacid decarboxylase